MAENIVTENVKYVTVSALNKYIEYKFSKDKNLDVVYLKGELSNCKKSGEHYYFSIKDDNSEITATLFRYSNKIDFDLEDGMSVLIKCNIKTYFKKGTYSANVIEIKRDGLGNLLQQYLDLKEKLYNEGLFDQSKKLILPEYPRKIGVITSPTGDAIRDIISTINNRYNLCEIIIYPALVQGQDAPKSLMNALEQAYNNLELDVIIIGRGGGSFEDLSCFNDERLARKIFSSPIPIVSSVGHEADFTIADFVASYRAATPTGAAIAVTKNKKDIYNDIENTNKIIRNMFLKEIKDAFHKYDVLYNKIISPLNYINDQNDKINLLIEKTNYIINNKLEVLRLKTNSLQDHLKPSILFDKLVNLRKIVDNNKKIVDLKYDESLRKKYNQYDNLNQKAILLNPLNLMSKGYSIVYQNDKIITSVKNINKDESLLIKMSDGNIDTSIKNIIPKEE